MPAPGVELVAPAQRALVLSGFFFFFFSSALRPCGRRCEGAQPADRFMFAPEFGPTEGSQLRWNGRILCCAVMQKSGAVTQKGALFPND